MVRGVKLQLFIGPAVPIPAPQPVIDALTSVRVTTESAEASVFQLTFALDAKSILHTLFLITAGAPIPLIRVIIVATMNGKPEVLIDGVVTNREVSTSDNGEAMLTVTGEDLSRVMDYIDFSGVPYPAMPAPARVALILVKYAVLGMVPMVIPTVLTDVPIPVEHIPQQDGKDLGYVKDLAERVGYVFYIEPGPAIGSSVAYWGPEIKVGVPQPPLNADFDAHRNVDSVSFNFDHDSKVLPIVTIHEPITKAAIPIPIPDISPLNPPLGAIPPIPKNVENTKDTAKLNPVQAAAIGMAKASKSSDAITASGSLDVTRYGHILKARKLVSLRGAGLAFNGLYYVSSVTHNISRGEYKQEFSLTRNGLVSTLPRVPV
jgi:hypothetical protein